MQCCKHAYAPDFHQVFDAPAKAIVKVVLPHDAGHARVGEDVGIACLLLPMPREGPMLLCATCKAPKSSQTAELYRLHLSDLMLQLVAEQDQNAYHQKRKPLITHCRMCVEIGH